MIVLLIMLNLAQGLIAPFCDGDKEPRAWLEFRYGQDFDGPVKRIEAHAGCYEPIQVFDLKDGALVPTKPKAPRK